MSTAVQRLTQALDAVAAAGDEGPRIFTQLYPEAAAEAAQAADARAARGLSLGPLDWRIVSVKDLFDVAGQVTTAGSALLQGSAAAQQDAVVVQRLRAAGAVVIGKTNMTEFAFSGIGINPHYGTPGNARDVTRIPGGSSSGAGVSVARGMAEIAIGSDTGGSIRIPSALNGITGFKPTQARVPRTGGFALSFTLDTVGPLAHSVLDCAQADAVLSGTEWKALPTRSAAGLRVGVPRGLLFTQTEDAVLQAFDGALSALSGAGAQLRDMALDEWLGAPFRLQEKGTIVASEAAYIHQEAMARAPGAFDPLVLARIRRGESIPAAHYVGLLQARAALQGALDAQLEDVDVLVLPTVPFVAPHIAALGNEEAFHQANMLVLRNPSVFNFYDLPALSLPIAQPAGALPVGLMVVGRRGQDRALLALGAALQQLPALAG